MPAHLKTPLTEPENLDRPLEDALHVTGKHPRSKLNLIVDGECVSWTSVCHFTQQIGNAKVRMGGIQSVGTDPKHRFKGYSRRVMEGSLAWMRAEGFDTAMLYGILHFYPKYGYAEAFPDIEFSTSTTVAGNVAPYGYRFENMKPEHMAAVLKLYHRNNAGRTGPTRRELKHYKPFETGKGRKPIMKVAFDKKKKLVGYFFYAFMQGDPVVNEIGYASPEVYPDLLHEIGRIARNLRLERINFNLSEDDAFMAYVQPLGFRKSMFFRKDGGGMVRMINIPNTMKKVAGVLGSRARGRGSLTIRTNLEDVGLKWSNGRCSVGKASKTGPSVRMPQWALAQLIYGYRGARAMVECETLKASNKMVDVLEELFPVQPHFHYRADSF